MQKVRHFRELPGYREIENKVSVSRTCSFQPINESIQQFEVVPLCLRHYSVLRLIQSPFLPPFQTPTGEDLATFLWVVSPGFTAHESKAKRQHFKRCRAFQVPEMPIWKTKGAIRRWEQRAMKALALQAPLVAKARDYISEALLDRPPSSGSARVQEFYCDEASFVGTIAREYGWSENEILEIPLKRLLQYLKEIHENFCIMVLKRKPDLWNPTDQLRRKYLEEINHN